MKAYNEAWFSFRGLRSDDMGVEMLARPKRTQPDANGTNCAVSGRSGRIWLDDGGWDNGSAEVTCMATRGNIDDVLAWLTGSGWLIFSDEPNRAYRARVISGVSRSHPIARLSGQKFVVRFDLQPYRYLWPETEALEFSAPDLIANPGTAPAQPKLRIEGQGDITVTVGFCTMAFEGVDGGIVVDTEAMECLDLSETQLRNACAQMEEFPTLPVGVSGVTWTGDVSRIVITPRWRFI